MSIFIKFSIFIVLTGCFVKSEQARRYFDVSTKTNNYENINTKNYEWNFIKNNQDYKLLAVNTPNGTVFADKENRYVAFDGWNIINVAGFKNSNEFIEIKVKDRKKYKIFSNKKFIREIICGNWIESSKTNLKVFEQKCEKDLPNARHGTGAEIGKDVDEKSPPSKRSR